MKAKLVTTGDGQYYCYLIPDINDTFAIMSSID